MNELITQYWPLILAAAALLAQRYGIKLPWTPNDPNTPTDLAGIIARIVTDILNKYLPQLASKEDIQSLPTRAEVDQIVANALVNRTPVEDVKKIRVEGGNLIIPQQLVQALSQ